ncbi:hypothetical protein [Mesorhizobium sp.]|uniref:hypothetical protein n=1 Tax=Mesorhizobium sp. TaxID=1871066 RepID=UPI0011F53B48|nr:hypothetical protein [Mesorhizobium sp.]TIX28852.1 MAG: hypothetical protein E5V35_00390 [Mesorhizobium sp.]
MATPVETLALSLSILEVAEILTHTDEPELLINWGKPAPTYPPELIAAARLADAMFSARFERKH